MDVRSVALDVSSRTSTILTKIIFREFLGFEPEWRDAAPDLNAMLADSDAALLIGDPALSLSSPHYKAWVDAFRGRGGSHSELRVFDLAELWHQYTGLGFVFAMWMTRQTSIDIDFAAARDEGIGHLDEIARNYLPATGLVAVEMISYLSESISYQIDDEMLSGMSLYFELAEKNGLVPDCRALSFV
jgi:chorismate dehydratase